MLRLCRGASPPSVRARQPARRRPNERARHPARPGLHVDEAALRRASRRAFEVAESSWRQIPSRSPDAAPEESNAVVLWPALRDGSERRAAHPGREPALFPSPLGEQRAVGEARAASGLGAGALLLDSGKAPPGGRKAGGGGPGCRVSGTEFRRPSRSFHARRSLPTGGSLDGTWRFPSDRSREGGLSFCHVLCF